MRTLIALFACVLGLGGCATTFECGDQRCSLPSQYCQSVTGGIPGSGTRHRCVEYREDEARGCEDYEPGSGCDCSNNPLTGERHVHCAAP